METRFHWFVRLSPVILACKSIELCKCSGKYIDIYFNLKITFFIQSVMGADRKMLRHLYLALVQS